MPLDRAEFPAEVQVAFFVYDMLSNRYAGMDGTYIGKDWTTCEYLFKLYKVDDRPEILFIMKAYENAVLIKLDKDSQVKAKAEKRRAEAQGGKKYTHNVKGPNG